MLYNKKMPSLKEKIIAQGEVKEEDTEKKVVSSKENKLKKEKKYGKIKK